MEEKFTPILENGEEVIEVFRPNKVKMIISAIAMSLFIAMFLAIGLVATYFGDDEAAKELGTTLVIVGCSVFAGILILSIVLSILYSQKTYYACTNKRLIIRTGIIGTDYKCLDLSMIGAVNVKVGIIDKMIKDTGTICFGSTSSPLNSQDSSNAFKFNSIENPYENYKKIKEYIEKARKTKEA